MPTDTTSLFIIRAWVEDGSERPLRATIRVSNDVGGGIDREVTLTDAGAVCDEVRVWLDGVVAG